MHFSCWIQIFQWKFIFWEIFQKNLKTNGLIVCTWHPRGEGKNDQNMKSLGKKLWIKLFSSLWVFPFLFSWINLLQHAMFGSFSWRWKDFGNLEAIITLSNSFKRFIPWSMIGLINNILCLPKPYRCVTVNICDIWAHFIMNCCDKHSYWYCYLSWMQCFSIHTHTHTHTHPPHTHTHTIPPHTHIKRQLPISL